MYSKLFQKILNSSVWLEPDATRLVWITFLAAKDKDGFAQFSAIGNLANAARVSIEDARAAVTTLESPDPESGNPEFEGRRIERVTGGWVVLNAKEYDEIVTAEHGRALSRNRSRSYRERHAQALPSREHHETVTISDSYSDSDTDTDIEPRSKSLLARKRRANGKVPHETTPDWFLDFKLAYPERAGGQGWRKALRAALARMGEGHTPEEFIAGAKRYAVYCTAAGKLGSEWVKQAATFLGPDKHFLENFALSPVVETPRERFNRLNSTPGETFEHESHPALETSR